MSAAEQAATVRRGIGPKQIVMGSNTPRRLESERVDDAYAALDALVARLEQAERHGELLREAYTMYERATFDAHDREWAAMFASRLKDALAARGVVGGTPQ